MTVPNKQARDDRLDELLERTEVWAARRRTYLQNQVKFSKRVLRGRQGAQGLNDASVQQADSLLVTELNEFLSGPARE